MDDDRRMPGACLSYKLTCEPLAQVSLKCKMFYFHVFKSITMTMFIICMKKLHGF